jgi:hypothetical protein
MANIIKVGNTVNGYTTTPDQSGALEIRTGFLAGGTTAMTIDPSQNVTFAGNLNVSGVLSGGGLSGVRQLLQTSIATPQTITSTSAVATNIVGSITPSSTTSKILVVVNIGQMRLVQGAATPGVFSLYRNIGAVAPGSIVNPWFASDWNPGVNTDEACSACAMFLDSPNTTSQVTYTVYCAVGVNYAPLTIQSSNFPSYMTLAEFKP